MVINSLSSALTFSVTGFAIVMMVLFIVIICIMAIMKLESLIFPPHHVPEHQEDVATADPMVLVLISAAIAAQYKMFKIRRIRRIGPSRKDNTWSEIGRSSHHGSHIIK